MEPKFKLEGVDEIRKALAEIDKKFASKITRSALRKGVKEIAAEVKATAPRGETGQLAKQIRVRAAKRSRSKIGVNIETTSPSNWYGQFQELGTSKMPASHWQRKAFEKTSPKALEIILRELKEGIEKLTK